MAKSNESKLSEPVDTLGMDPASDAGSTAKASVQSPPATATKSPVDTGELYCPVHNCKMISSSARAEFTLYRCRVKGCQEKGAKQRPNVATPIEPTICPQCAGENPKTQIACTVIQQWSTAVKLHMECPTCSWSVKVPRPDASRLVARDRRQDKTIMGTVTSNIY